MGNFVAAVGQNFNPDPTEDIKISLFKQYERVIVESLITSFGLDFIVKDRYGGDVDTIHNVRKIGTDEKMEYKNVANEKAYENRGEYSKREYHGGNVNYQRTVKETRNNAPNGVVEDSYVPGKKITLRHGKNASTDKVADLDHVISAKDIHDDRGRVLAGMNGADLANSPENLKYTNAHLNRSMRDSEIPDYLSKHPELPEDVKKNMLDRYNAAKDSYEKKLRTAYYNSAQFRNNMLNAAKDAGKRMALRQALGFLFANIWFEIKDEFEKEDIHFGLDMDIGEFFRAIGDGVKRGIEKTKSMETVSKVVEGGASGFFASITTTLCNVFFTTAKNVVKIIRESWASIVQALKILLLNPDGYLFGDRVCAAAKVLATGASVVAGSLVSGLISSTPLGGIPVVGDITQTFVGTLVSGVLTCSLLYYLDNSKRVKNLVGFLNNIPSVEKSIEYFRLQADYLEEYAAKLMNIDIETFRREINTYSEVADEIVNASSEEGLNEILNRTVKRLNLHMPWESYGSFDNAMRDPNFVLSFK